MKRAKWYLLLAGTLLFVGGCTEEPPVPPITPVTPTQYSSISIPIEEFPNQPHIDAVMSALVGQELTVTLGSNLTTGFQWLEAEISDESIIQQVSRVFVLPEAEGDPVPGTPGKEIWTFKALKKGTTTIFMECSRQGDTEYWTVTITVNIGL
jgi:predicted secreted protein